MMSAIAQKIYNELSWFIGRKANLTTILSSLNDYEYFYKGKVEVALREVSGDGEMIDIFLKEKYSQGINLAVSLLNDYKVHVHDVHGYVHKTLSIYLGDGSLVTLAYIEEEGDLQQTDIELTDDYVRYLFHLSNIIK